jgi:mannose-6-phosphate isomerase-like protein (cupin superfamily)
VEVVGVDPTKRLLMDRLRAEARGFELRLAEVNAIKPWGGYLRFTQDSLGNFLSAYWLDVEMKLPVGDVLVDPKVLLVAPRKVLSLQWHERRDELWRVIDGPVRVVTGGGWNSLQVCDYETGEVIDIPQGQWHRLIGLANWGRVAEIWQHTDPQHLSEEQDILRVQDYYGRVDVEADQTTPMDQRGAVWAAVYPQICAQAGLAP